MILLISGFARFSTAKPLSNLTFDEEYDVFYQEPFHVILPRAKDIVPRAYRRVIRQWGLEDSGGLGHPLLVQIKQLNSKTIRRWEAAYVESRGSGNNLRQSLVIDIGAYVENPDEDLNLVITHEMAHVSLMDVIAGPQAAPIPPWFNEGLAQSVTREGRDRVKADIASLRQTDAHLLLCDLDGPLDEFAHGPFNGGCYPEFYLAVRRLEQLGGPQTLRKAITGLRQGVKLPDLTPSLTGMDWSFFKREAEHYTDDVFAGLKPVP